MCGGDGGGWVCVCVCVCVCARARACDQDVWFAMMKDCNCVLKKNIF